MKQHTLVAGWAMMLSGPVLAANLTDFLPAEVGASACWQRTYDQAHLNAHPDQQVTAMSFSMNYLTFEDDSEGFHVFGVEARLRDGRNGEGVGSCWADTAGIVRCGVDCDGGGLALRLDESGNLLADLEAMGYIRLEGGCDGAEDAEIFSLEPGLDDKLFLLHPTSAKVCKSLMPGE